MVPSMDLHPLAASFLDVADPYERGRPEYTPAVAEAIAAELHIAPSARVLDLAAGTGKLTRALLGLYNSIWHWYRPRGQVSLEEVTEFFLRRQLEVLGLPPELADGDRSAARAVTGKSGPTTRAARGRRRPTR